VHYFADGQGGAKVAEAGVIFQELAERHNWTAFLYNCAAACAMQQGNWDEAEQLLQDAYEKDAKNPDTLANLATVGLHLGKNTSRYTKCVPPCHLLHTLGPVPHHGSVGLLL
jgi:coatomer protein complex subunit epsilon